MNIYNSIKMQFSLMIHKLSFQVGFSIVMLYTMVSYIKNLLDYRGVDKLYFYSANFLYAGNNYASFWGIFESAFPFIIVLPFAFSYLDDLNIKITPYILSRMSKEKYFMGKLITCFLGGFIIIFIPFLINLIFCNITFPENHNTLFGPYNLITYYERLTGADVYINTDFKGQSFLKLYLYSPLLYNFLYLFILSTFAGIMSVFSGACSYFLSKYKIILFIPVYLIIFLGKSIDSYIYLNNQKIKYIDCKWLEYVSINFHYGKSYILFGAFLICCMFFSIISLLFICRKDIT
jgi:hypothetical protein